MYLIIPPTQNILSFYFFYAIKFLGFTLKIVVFNRKCIAKIINPITKPQFLTIIKLTYTGIK